MYTDVELAKKLAARIREVEQHGIMATGKIPLIAFLKGETVHRADAVKAYCYGCMGYFTDGKGDCGDPICPLYPWFQYKSGTELNISDENE